mmetsp:Transcript_33202/g.80081  ORF Transcript_33202/g.80081 Transcript_33202/m.80081 type:complete len:215 (-) Transcript_33202:1977-2621(-)
MLPRGQRVGVCHLGQRLLAHVQGCLHIILLPNNCSLLTIELCQLARQLVRRTHGTPFRAYARAGGDETAQRGQGGFTPKLRGRPVILSCMGRLQRRLGWEITSHGLDLPLLLRGRRNPGAYAEAETCHSRFQSSQGSASVVSIVMCGVSFVELLRLGLHSSACVPQRSLHRSSTLLLTTDLLLQLLDPLRHCAEQRCVLIPAVLSIPGLPCDLL